MRAVIQRVSRAAVTVAGGPVRPIGRGLVILLGVTHSDAPAGADWLARKAAALRIFPDDEGKMNRSLADLAGEALVVSQFTLYGDARRGARPSFIAAARPEQARPLYEHFVRALEAILGRPVITGEFGADMVVEIHNDGPVTLLLDTAERGG